MSAQWNEYYQKILNQPHRPNVENALNLLKLESKVALDIGCGIGRDSHFLLEQGFNVHAFDSHEDAVKTCLTRFEGHKRFSISQCCFTEFDYPQCSLVIANASLFFCPDESFEQVWTKIDSALQPGGIFCGDFLGVKDSWVASEMHPNITALTKKEVESLFEDYELISLNERDEDGATVVGSPKHWHMFSVTARKR
ncbi:MULTISPECIES: bifunctional 2-polyprenyl-6-hydroxyphenol methylase/3-demethylubiquinol 3-O-methyltransferase UbiG [unclassified Vibrio]|uniref:class I SAM-dependent methyltransferase n=1 Tax=unclassified Vibrio TaxID=2614977 RepID=UPI0020A5144B|nr:MULTISPECIES: class I SAM-dependent methyltransferase [unclassified Vibrio]HDU8577141.1 methyltransferase domain-containing protein [Vibrio diabolicus]